MPIYEYACTPCGETFEELVLRASDEAELRCPRCGSDEVGRRMSRPAAARVSGGGGGRVPPSCGPVG